MKRTFDLIFAFVILIPVLLFVLILSVLIIIVDGFSPFYLQKRVGKHGKLFICFKLQTMRPATDKSVIGEREKDWERFTKLGMFIRDHGWDELPQIFNVLRGEMSFIGPRPLLPKTFDRIRKKNPDLTEKIDRWEKKRESVRPGISGLHQIATEDEFSLIEYDLEYFEDFSLLRAIQVLYTTILIFMFGKRFENIAPVSV